MASTIFTANLMAADIGSSTNVYNYDGDIINNPWGDIFTSEDDYEQDYVLLSNGKNVTVSGVESNATTGQYAVDQNTGTRWSSNFADNAWITVDLGNVYSVDKVVLNWEAAYGAAYNIQVSTDGTNWITVKSLSNQNGGEDVVTFSAVNARYVKMQGVTRALPYGYSLWEMSVYGR